MPYFQHRTNTRIIAILTSFFLCYSLPCAHKTNNLSRHDETGLQLDGRRRRRRRHGQATKYAKPNEEKGQRRGATLEWLDTQNKMDFVSTHLNQACAASRKRTRRMDNGSVCIPFSRFSSPKVSPGGSWRPWSAVWGGLIYDAVRISAIFPQRMWRHFTFSYPLPSKKKSRNHLFPFSSSSSPSLLTTEKFVLDQQKKGSTGARASRGGETL